MAECASHPQSPEPAQGEPTIVVNGRACPLPADGKLSTLLADLGIGPQTAGVAVAVNDRLVPRAEWAGRRLAAGDRVEVVRAVAGG